MFPGISRHEIIASCCIHILIVEHYFMPIKISKKIEKQICQLYDNGVGTNEISTQLKVHRATVQRILIRNGIKLRKTSPYKKKYNVKYFDKYTPENCYWAGFILADGTIRSDRDAVEIHLQKKDKKHLLKFAEAIGFTGGLIDDKSSKAYTISIAGKWFPDALKKNFSIGCRKSLTSVFPTQVPKKYWTHLIRGYFDGDGCITRPSCPNISFIGTNMLLQFLSELFYGWGIRLKSKNKCAPLIKTPNEIISHISYSGLNALKILNRMYDYSTPAIRLDRKYKRFIKYFGIQITGS